ncbi:hypothetical protein PsorP6_006526 [Peronosclerospora sorghi]|uniref:Uncharacterized protein n=1 Tax=Peronosclerospora sorghi TaxID=230839 RepID=A0ACC0W575_9STRA|nr:hypothetical protein PsorP6_006526 [Peronosclerospora sorghi]
MIATAILKSVSNSHQVLNPWPFKRFNPIQTQVLPRLLESESNLFIGSPPGSGKSILAELAIMKTLLSLGQPDPKSDDFGEHMISQMDMKNSMNEDGGFDLSVLGEDLKTLLLEMIRFLRCRTIFEGTMHDMPDNEEGGQNESEDREDFHHEMGDFDQNDENVVDKKLWGEDSDDDEDRIDEEKLMFEENSEVEGEALEDEVRGNVGKRAKNLAHFWSSFVKAFGLISDWFKQGWLFSLADSRSVKNASFGESPDFKYFTYFCGGTFRDYRVVVF